MATQKKLFDRRRQRVRTQLRKKASGRARLSIHRTNLHIYAQIIDDAKGATLASASSLEKDSKANGHNVEGATAIGSLIAERAKKAGVTDVVFDRGGFLYHGRVKALADAAREGGLSF